MNRSLLLAIALLSAACSSSSTNSNGDGNANGGGSNAGASSGGATGGGGNGSQGGDSGSDAPLPAADFQTRCAAAGVVRCVGFDDPADIVGGYGDVHGVLVGEVTSPTLDTTMKASGSSSLVFDVPGKGGANSAGAYFTNFSDDLATQFDSGDEFYVQWRQRFSASFLSNAYQGGGGWKQIDISEGDRPTCSASNANSTVCGNSCTSVEIVMFNWEEQGLPVIYHSCGAKDDQYEPLAEPVSGQADFLLQNGIRSPGCLYTAHGAGSPCMRYVADEWLTFQMHVKVGTWYQDGSHVYKHDSTIQTWIAREGQPSELVVDFSPKDPSCQAEQESEPACQTGYDLANTDPGIVKYGKIWLLPYDTGRDATVENADAQTWFDELIVSRNKIADPK